MKKVFLTCIILTVLTNPNFAQPSVEPIGWLPYWGQFFDVAVSGDVALTVCDYGLLSFDVSDPSQPELLDQVALTGRYWNRGSELVGIQIIGEVANVQAGSLYRLDISDPSNLELLPELPSNLQTRGYEFVQIDDYIYTVAVADRRSYLYVIDVSDTENPVVVDSTLRVSGKRLDISDSILVNYVEDFGLYCNITFLSLQNPENPEIVGSYRSESTLYPYWNYKPRIVGTLFFTGTSRHFEGYYFECIDFSDPTEPFLRWSHERDYYPYLVGSVEGLLGAVGLEEDEWSLGLYSTEDPDTLVEVVRFHDQLFSYPREITLQDDILHVASELGLHCFDFSDLESVELLGRFRSRTCRNDLGKIDDYLTVALNDSTLRVIYVENPENPVEVSDYHLEAHYFRHCTWTHPEGSDYVVTLSPSFDLTVIDISDAESPETVGFLEMLPDEERDIAYIDIAPWSRGVLASAMVYNYDDDVDSTWSCFNVISLDNPENPEVIGSLSIDRQGAYAGFCFGMAVNEEMVYIPHLWWTFSGSYIISIEDPSQPEIVSHLEEEDAFYYPIALEHDLMISYGTIFSLADPVHPERIGQIDRSLREPLFLVTSIQHGLVAVSDYGETNFHLYNVRNPEEPFLIDAITLPDNPTAILMEDGLIYVVENSGIEILQYTGGDAVQESKVNVPNTLTLRSIYPNPFNAQVNITFEVPNETEVSLELFDLNGRLVTTLVEDRLNAGSYTTHWDGAEMTSGIYLVRLKSDVQTITRKIVLVR